MSIRYEHRMSDTSDDLRVEPEEDGSRGRFKLLGGEGQLLGQMTFSRARDDLIIVDHTEVDDSLQGKGGGSRLFNAMVAWACAGAVMEAVRAAATAPATAREVFMFDIWNVSLSVGSI